jgi:ribosomal protein S18 acetylase RimI-like enzyme
MLAGSAIGALPSSSVMPLTLNVDSPMKLRAYVPADWDRLCAIHDSARLHELQASGIAQAFLSLEQAAEGEGLFEGQLMVAEDQGQVLGFVAFADGELTWLYVDPASYRQGVGRLLLRHAIEACGGQVSTEVLVGNDAALSLYLSEGFQVIKRVDGRLTGNESHAASGYVLQRMPSEPAA